jgi:hypothetical protein
VKALPRIVEIEVEGDFDLSPTAHRMAVVSSGSGVSGSGAAIRWSSLLQNHDSAVFSGK